MSGLLEGTIQSLVAAGLKSGGVLLDVTVTKRSSTYVPGTGTTVVETPTRIAACGFPDGATGRYMAQTNLSADESLVVLAQKPLRDVGLSIQEGDHVTVHRGSGNVKRTIMEVTEDPAEATYVCRAKGTA